MKIRYPNWGRREAGGHSLIEILHQQSSNICNILQICMLFGWISPPAFLLVREKPDSALSIRDIPIIKTIQCLSTNENSLININMHLIMI